MLNPFHQKSATEKIGTALGISMTNHGEKAHKSVSFLMHALLYISIFLAGYIIAKVQTLVSSI